MYIVFLDAKSDVLYPNYGDKINQLSYMITDREFNIVDFKNFYFDRDETSDKSFKSLSDEIYEDLKGNHVVCYDVNYSVPLVRYELWELEKKDNLPFNRYSSIMVSSLHILDENYSYYAPDGHKFPKIEELTERLNITCEKVNSILDKCFDDRYDVVCIYLICKEFVKIQQQRYGMYSNINID